MQSPVVVGFCAIVSPHSTQQRISTASGADTGGGTNIRAAERQHALFRLPKPKLFNVPQHTGRREDHYALAKHGDFNQRHVLNEIE